jgi:hypothetical protein
MMDHDTHLERARMFGRTSLGIGIAAMILPWSNPSKGVGIVYISLALGVAGVLLSLPALDARKSIRGPIPGEPMAGLIASLMAIFMCGILWFFDLAMAQHGSRP